MDSSTLYPFQVSNKDMFSSPTSKSPTLRSRKITANFSQNMFSAPKYVLDAKRMLNLQKNIHKKILDIGDNCHANLVRDFELQYSHRENEIANQICKQKEIEIDNEREKLRSRLEESKADIKKKYDRLLKDKAVEIEKRLNKLVNERIELQNENAKKALEETIARLNNRHEIEKAEAVALAKQHEKEIANERIKENIRVFEIKQADLNKEWSNKIQNIIEEQRLKFQREKADAIQKSIEKVKFEENLKYDKILDEHKNIVIELRNKIQEQNKEKESLVQEIEKIKNDRNKMKQFIKELKSEFQRFYEDVSKMQQGDAEYIFSKLKILNM